MPQGGRPPNLVFFKAFLDLLRERMDLRRLDESGLREMLAVYYVYVMITKVEAVLGRLVGTLRAGGHWDDTAVLLFSDHGEYAGDRSAALGRSS